MGEETNEDATENVSSTHEAHPPPASESPTTTRVQQQMQTRATPFPPPPTRGDDSPPTTTTTTLRREEQEEQEEATTLEIVPELPPPGAMRRHRRCILRNACCCLTLQQGAIIIGGFQVGVIVLHLLMETLYLAGVLLAGSYALNDDLTGNLPGDEERWGSMDIAYASISGIILFQELIALLFAAMLLHGARKRRPSLVRAWLLFTAFLLAVDLGLWAARLTLEFLYYPTRGGILIIRAFFTLCTPVYFLLVVRSFYYEMLDEEADLERGGGGGVAMVAAPLLYSKAMYSRDLPPPYTPATMRPAPDGGAGGGGDVAKRPLETDLDDVDAGFGAGWHQARAAAEWGVAARQQQLQRQRREDTDEDEEEEEQQAGPLPSKVRPASLADPEQDTRVQLRSSVRYYDEDGGDRDYDEVADDEGEAELEAARRRTSRRIVGAGRMVLPPLPPGARASLQHVAPPVAPSPSSSSSSFRQPTLI